MRRSNESKERESGRYRVKIWREVEDALERIIEDYERVNHLISFFQDDRARHRGLEKIGKIKGVALELGSGPGNFTQMLQLRVEGFLVCLDFSDKMLRKARAGKHEENIGFIRGVFEALPIRSGVISLTAAAYALRDSTDKKRALKEIENSLRKRGSLLIIDIGKPNNPLAKGFFSLYMRHVMPIMGGLASGYGYRNPWNTLYKTYVLLPVNKSLLDMMKNIVGHTELEEPAFGGLIVAIATKKG